MAIRPTDFLSSIFQASQTAPLTQRAEEGPRAAQQAAQASFAALLQQREERVDHAGEVLGNHVDANPEREGDGEGYDPEQRAARDEFREVVDEAAGLEEPPHLIDFTA